MIDIETYNDRPNFSVIVPQPCNMACSFCSNRDVCEGEDDWLEKLRKLIWEFPSKFSQVTITGGEPLLYKWFRELVLILRKRFTKVVVSTNGTNFGKLVDTLVWVNDVNVSYHGLDDEWAKDIFGTGILPDVSAKDIQTLRAWGTGVTRNWVIQANGKPNKHEVETYATNAKMIGYSSVAFRYDMRAPDGLDMKWAPLEYLNVISDDKCPVCRTVRCDIDGFPVFFKASVMEPRNALDAAYELIYTSEGILSTTWDGKNPVGEEEMTATDNARLDRMEKAMAEILRRLDEPKESQRQRIAQRVAYVGTARDSCGGSGCGGGHC